MNYIVLVLIALAIAAVCIVLSKIKFDFRCGRCGEISKISLLRFLVSPRRFGVPVVRCRKCGQRAQIWLVPKDK